MAHVAAVLPGYATVRHGSDVLHLAPRSVRDLIYSGRLPSLRIGRLHFLRVTDLELERRRRLGLQLPHRQPRVPRARTSEPSTRPRVERGHVDPTRRRERAAERAALVNEWAERHHLDAPDVPFAVTVASVPIACAICARTLKPGARILQPAQAATSLCLTCGRRVLLDWSDRRRQEAAAARRLAQTLGANAAPPPAARIAPLAPLQPSEEAAMTPPSRP
ncbi:MAG TPA: helix-turn-helix domain-containing protein [Chloroflexota bacterium]|nr:helix-turn-helix domain-containing protein [Chloroflexota bacterium]